MVGLYHTHLDQDTNMEFYPHNIPIIYIASAVSASRTNTGSLIANFSAIAINTVNTASVALNITGSPGTAGTHFAVIGPTGNTGPQGETGYRGDSIFLLSGSWNTNACSGTPVPPICYGAYTLYNVAPGGDCPTNIGSSLYYSNYFDLTSSAAPNGFKLYSDETCTTIAADVTTHNGSLIFYTDAVGTISSVGCSI